MTIDPIDLLFRFDGRINRGKYWLTVVLWLAVWLLVFALVYASGFSWLSIAIAALVFIPSLWSGIAVGIKRLHDREMSGTWLVLFYGAPVFLDALARPLFVYPQMAAFQWIGAALSFLSFAVSIWALVVLGFLRGTIGANAYGPDPVAPKPKAH